MRNTNLKYKPDFEKSMDRINAWYEGEIIDRAPIKFGGYAEGCWGKIIELRKKFNFKTIEEQWLSEDYQIESYKLTLPEKPMLGDDILAYWPNLGPNVFAAYYGGKIEFTDSTSWTEHILSNAGYGKFPEIQFDGNYYFDKIESLTKRALEEASDRFFVGYTDLHPAVDCVASFRSSESLCFDLFEYPEEVKALTMQTVNDFKKLFEHYNKIVNDRNPISLTWMGIPSYESVHIPSCDFSFMISPSQFDEFVMPSLQEEVRIAKHNIFHVDGIGVANHLDRICELKEIQALQWVQGPGDATPILQWVELIKRMQSKGKSVVVYLTAEEIDEFIQRVPAKGMLLCCNTSDTEIQGQILKKLEKWKM